MDNDIIEIGGEKNNTLESDILEEVTRKEPEKKEKVTLKDKWNRMPKKKRTIIIISTIAVLLIILGVVAYFVFFNKEEEEPIEVDIIITQDNYRYENGKLVFFNKEQDLGLYDCKEKDPDKCHIAKIDLTSDTIDRIKSVYENGKEIIKNTKIYFDKYVFIEDGGKIYLYDLSNKSIPKTYDNIKVYDTSFNYVVIETEGKTGLIELFEDEIKEKVIPVYDDLEFANTKDYLLVAKDKETSYVIDVDGKKLSSGIKGDIKTANKDYIVVYLSQSYNLYDYNNEELLSDYDFINLHDNVISLVKGGRLYLVNKDLKKLYEDGLRLSDNNYVKVYTYNDNNKLLDYKEAYSLEINNDICVVTIDGTSKNINMVEGALSGNLAYANYFDGKYYFYSDLEKENLIGTYNCTNKNNLKTGDEGLARCHVYSTEDGMSSIYNQEFVFIDDNAINGSRIFYLYDIKESKNKGTYAEIDFLTTGEIHSNLDHVFTSSSFIKAKSGIGSNKGNYGILEINSEGIKAKVDFKYKEINYENKYYVLIDVGDKYSLYDDKFNLVTNSNQFNYIKVFDSYYAGITEDNKLNLYRYNGTTILNESINNASKEFTIKAEGEYFTISMNGTDYTYNNEGMLMGGE